MFSIKNLFNKGKNTTSQRPEPSYEENAPLQSSPVRLCADDIFLGHFVSSKEAALALIADHLQKRGYVQSDYLAALQEREEQISTYLLNGVAIPHGTKEAKSLVQKTGVVVVQFPNGVVWTKEGDTVHLAVAIAANSDEHLQLLAHLTSIVMDESLAKNLGSTSNKEDILLALGGISKTDTSKNPIQDYTEQGTANIMDPEGIHARPATEMAQLAEGFKDTDIRLRFGQKIANAKSMPQILTLGATYGDSIVISAQGLHAQAAILALAHAIESGFDPQDNARTQHTHYENIDRLGNIPHPIAAHIFEGIAASPGIAVAPVFILRDTSLTLQQHSDTPNEEWDRLTQSLDTAFKDLETLYTRMQQHSPYEAEVFRAHQKILQDIDLIKQTKKTIHKGHSAAWSWHHVLNEQANALQSLEDERIRERGADFRDVAQRVVHLLEHDDSTPSFPDTPFILFATELTPSQTASLKDTPIQAICTELGGPNSHMAILARSLGIPALVGVGHGVIDRLGPNDNAIIAPQSAQAIINPDANTRKQAENLIQEWNDIKKNADAHKFQPAITTDGHRIDIVCNISRTDEAATALEKGGEGVGLLRTEFMFESSSTEPTLEEQIDQLKQAAEIMEERVLIIRTADIGGDKPVSWLNMPKESNPFLGIRGIRLSLRNPNMFKTQLSAIYQTALWQQEQGITSGIHIMFPMISTLEEWRTARAIAEDIRHETGAPYLPLGIMVEIPSAALLADYFAKEVDFFSIGSNDLTQYTLAADRLHPELAKDVDDHSLALFRLIEITTKAARQHGKWVGVCGNMASDPQLARLLVGLGVTELSIAPSDVPEIKMALRNSTMQDLKEKAHAFLYPSSS